MKRDFDQLKQGPFDVLVVGGGIYGIWTAYDLSLRGYKVALVEQADWANGASSCSSKLLHGGLRYLEHYEFGLVRKSLRERNRLWRLAPHRVKPLKFLVPVYKQSRVGLTRMRLGLWLYDLLSTGPQPVEKRHSFSRSEVESAYPFLNANDLCGAVMYGDGQMDDARFAIEVLSGAVAAGCVAVNYAAVTDWVRSGNRYEGALVKDEINNTELEVRANVVVTATGPWLNQLFASPEKVRCTKGVHILLPALPVHHAMLLTARSDGRVFFVIPWYGRTMVGTTDTDFNGDPDQVQVEPDDVAYLLDELNHALKVNYKTEDIVGAFAGLRALKPNKNKSPSKVTRDWGVQRDGENMFLSIGGKFTSAREDAERLVDRVVGSTAVRSPSVQPSKSERTSDRSFPWAPSEPFAGWCDRKQIELVEAGFDGETAKTSVFRFGTNVERLIALAKNEQALADRLCEAVPFSRAEVVLIAEKEMVVTLIDLLRRRMPLAILSPLSDSVLTDAASLAARVLDWSEDKQERLIQEFKQASVVWRR